MVNETTQKKKKLVRHDRWYQEHGKQKKNFTQ